MDILNSKVVNIEGRLYISYFEEEAFSNGDDFSAPAEDFSRHIDAPNKVEDASGQRETKLERFLQCPNALFKYVIGVKGQTIKRLQAETGAKIEIPRGGTKRDSCITVTAKSLNSMEMAVTRIELLLSEKRWKQPFGHFVSIPLTSQCIKNKFCSFKSEVLEKCGADKGVTDRLFQNEDKIHLTICTLTLLDDSESEKATEVLQRVVSSQLLKDAREMNVSVCGIEYMNDDPEMVDVLYAKVSCPEKPDLLPRIANMIAQEFEAAGLAKKEYDHVKLHATVMNTVRTMEKTDSHQKGRKTPNKRETFDASKILTTFKDYAFGEFPLTEIHISKRHTVDKNGYYESLYVANIQI